MGNKQSANPDNSQTVQQRHPSPVVLNSALTSEAVEALENCFQTFPLNIKDAQRETLIREVEVKRFTRAKIVLKKGEQSDGIYVVVSGRVQLVTENGAVVLKEIVGGDFFGEVSVIFNRKCTADVHVDSR